MYWFQYETSNQPINRQNFSTHWTKTMVLCCISILFCGDYSLQVFSFAPTVLEWPGDSFQSHFPPASTVPRREPSPWYEAPAHRLWGNCGVARAINYMYLVSLAPFFVAHLEKNNLDSIKFVTNRTIVHPFSLKDLKIYQIFHPHTIHLWYIYLHQGPGDPITS